MQEGYAPQLFLKHLQDVTAPAMSGSCMEPHSPVHKVWKPELYKFQLDAPTPKPIVRRSTDVDHPADFYGLEFHGTMDHKQSELLLNATPDGSYMLRRSPGAQNFYTLSLRFDQRTKHYRIHYEPGLGHFLKQDLKHFETVHDLVADGLLNFYMQAHAAPIIASMMTQTYHQSPYMTLNRRKLRALSSDMRKSLRPDATTVDGCGPSKLGAPSKDWKDIFGSVDNMTASASTEDGLTEDVLPIVYEKSHNFKTHTFKGLNWCEFCANFLWGFTAQGVKCEDCGFMAHSKCSELVPAKCVPDLKRIRGVFGTDLTTLVAAHQCVIPFVVRRCVDEVEARGMLQEGIYRVSGFADEIDALKLALDRNGEKTNLSEATYGNVNVIAGTLKLYLRLLPVPLVTFGAYAAFIAAASFKTVGEQVNAIREAMKFLPVAHFNCLKFVIEHLNRIASHHAVNKMNEHNLATVFAPTLIAIPNHLTDLSQEICMLSALIAHCQAIYC